MFSMKKRLMKTAVVLAVVILACSNGYAATINVHWTPNLNSGGISHGATVSGLLIIDIVDSKRSRS